VNQGMIFGYGRTVLLSGLLISGIGFLNFHFLLAVDVTLPMLLLPFLVGGAFGGLIHHINILRENGERAERMLSDALKASDRLLAASMPKTIIARLKAGERPIIDRVAGVQILFIDIVGFTAMADRTEVTEVAHSLDTIFRTFERVCHTHQVRKLKTVGDAFVAVHGIDQATKAQDERLARAALDILRVSKGLTLPDGATLEMRMGLHVGTVVIGVLGDDVPTFDMWGDAVNTASRLEGTGMPGKVSCSSAIHDLLETRFEFELFGSCEMKGKGELDVWHLVAERKE